MTKICGIYKLTAPNGHCYIGSSKNVHLRWKTHHTQMWLQQHENSKLNRAYAKYGQLEASLLLICEEKDLLMYEQLCLDALQPEYNCSMVAGRVEFTEEVRAKMREAQTGVKLSDETRAKMSASGTGRKFTEEHCRKIGEGNRRRVWKLESRQKSSAKKKGKPWSAARRAAYEANPDGHKREIGPDGRFRRPTQ